MLRNDIQSLPFNEIHERQMTAWQDQGDFEKYPADHPRNFLFTSSVGFIGRKTIEKVPAAMNLFENDKLLDFLSQVSNTKLYRSNDENGSVYVYRLTSSSKAPWHFDESHYTAILYLENSSTGGQLELVPWCRPTKSKDDLKGHEIVQEVLMDGNTAKVRRVNIQPGMLVFFCGSHSFLRAAPISGGGSSSLRMGLVFTFGESEAFSNSQDVQNNNQWDPTKS